MPISTGYLPCPATPEPGEIQTTPKPCATPTPSTTFIGQPANESEHTPNLILIGLGVSILLLAVGFASLIWVRNSRTALRLFDVSIVGIFLALVVFVYVGIRWFL